MSFLVPSSPPSNVTAVSNDASSIDVSWNDVPTPDQNGVITGYLVFYRESSATTYTIAATMQLKLKIQGLSAATSYSLRVQAYNSNGNGIASELITLTTREKGSIINDSDDFVTSYSFAYRNLSFSFWPPLLKYHMKQKPKCRLCKYNFYKQANKVELIPFIICAAPSLPPQSISVVPMSAFSLFVEWTHPPRQSWNGIIAGYKVDIRSDDGSYSKSVNVDGTVVNMNVNGLSPDRLYIVDVCASTSVGTGPCIRSYNKTFVSSELLSLSENSSSIIILSFYSIFQRFLFAF